MQARGRLSRETAFLDQRSRQGTDSLLPGGILRIRKGAEDRSIAREYHRRSVIALKLATTNSQL